MGPTPKKSRFSYRCINNDLIYASEPQLSGEELDRLLNNVDLRVFDDDLELSFGIFAGFYKSKFLDDDVNPDLCGDTDQELSDEADPDLLNELSQFVKIYSEDYRIGLFINSLFDEIEKNNDVVEKVCSNPYPVFSDFLRKMSSSYDRNTLVMYHRYFSDLYSNVVLEVLGIKSESKSNDKSFVSDKFHRYFLIRKIFTSSEDSELFRLISNYQQFI